MFYRYYDRPVELFKEAISTLSPSLYDAQFKADGWLTHIFRDSTRKISKLASKSDYYFLSRRDMTRGGPTFIPVSDPLVQQVESLGLPDQSCVAAEWMARRTVGEIPETLFVFDLMWLGGEWMGEIAFSARIVTVNKFFEGKSLESVKQMPLITTDFAAEFAKMQKESPWTEGLVFKKKSGKLKGDSSKGVDNGAMVKVKWRSGASGREVFNA